MSKRSRVSPRRETPGTRSLVDNAAQAATTPHRSLAGRVPQARHGTGRTLHKLGPFSVFLGALLALVPVWAIAATRPAPSQKPVGVIGGTPQPAPATSPNPAPREETFAFRDLGATHPIALNGIDGSDTLGFGLRRDQVVLSATLRLQYNFSPSLLPELSHIKIYLNEEVVAAVPLPKEQAGAAQHRDIPLDPRYFSDFNQLRLQLIGHYTTDCEEALHSSLWASISARSELVLNVRPMALPDELALLPAPFFDVRDNRTLEVPFVFGRQPALATLRAAGMLASWLGALADYRQTRFPVLIDQLPERHTIVWAANDNAPVFLHLPPAEGPGLTIMPHPTNGHFKLLVLTGRDAADLETAARALVLGQPGLSGTRATIGAVQLPAPRAAYDAPNWLPSQRPAKLGELIRSPEELQVRTRTPRLIELRIRMPPDILIWQNDGVPIDLHYRYTPPPKDDNSSLNIGINDEFLSSLPLWARTNGANVGEVVLPLRDDAHAFHSTGLKLPAFQVHGDNQLQFQFTFDYHPQGLCRSFQLDNVRAAIDPDSTIDISGFPHYAELPDLAAFAHAGFPFTKYADLAETTVIVPDHPTTLDIEALLSTLGHFGRSTGLPAFRFRLVGASAIDTAAETDLFVIDTTSDLPLLKRWREQLPASIGDGIRTVSSQFQTWPSYALHDPAAPGTTHLASQTTARADGPLAALLGFESPLTRGRSVVVLTANGPVAAHSALQALHDPARSRSIRGTVAYIRGEHVESFQVGDTYFVGHLPVWTWTWFHVSRHPLLLAIGGVIAGFLAAFLAYGGLKRVAEKRLQH